MSSILTPVRHTLAPLEGAGSVSSTTSANLRRSRPHSIEVLVMRLSLAMLLWAQRRAERTQLTPEQHSQLVAQERARSIRDHADALRAARIR